MGVIDFARRSVQGRWPPRLTERQTEITFGAGLLLSVIVLFAIGEALAQVHNARRGTSDGFDWIALMNQMEADTSGGPWRLPANSQFGHLKLNSRGFRGPDIPLAKPPGTQRLVFLGDSKILNAEFEDEFTVAERTVAALERMLPACRFDYKLLAGPAYRMEELAHLARNEASALDPDVFIMLSGSRMETILLHGEADPDGGFVRPYPLLAHYSLFYQKLWRSFNLVREERLARARPPLSDDVLAEVAATIAGPALQIAAVTGDTPVLAVGYRGRLRPEIAYSDKLWITRSLRASTRGIGSEDLARLDDHIADALEDASGRHGWTFIDPILDFAPTEENFVDNTHFTRRATVLFSARLAEALTPLLKQRATADTGSAGACFHQNRTARQEKGHTSPFEEAFDRQDRPPPEPRQGR